MKRLIRTTLVSVIAIVGLLVAVPAVSVGAVDVFSGTCGGSSGGTTGGSDSTGGGAGAPAQGEGGGSGGSSSSICGAVKQDDAPDIIKNVINTILIVLGMVAVIMIVIGGIRYTLSNGDASSVKGAKDTILYAVVGLVIAILSFAIVNFVLGQLS